MSTLQLFVRNALLTFAITVPFTPRSWWSGIAAVCGVLLAVAFVSRKGDLSR